MSEKLKKIFKESMATAVAVASLSGNSGYGGNFEVIGVTTKQCTVAENAGLWYIPGRPFGRYLGNEIVEIPPGSSVIKNPNPGETGLDNNWKPQTIDSYVRVTVIEHFLGIKLLPIETVYYTSNLGSRYDGPCDIKYGVRNQGDINTVIRNTPPAPTPSKEPVKTATPKKR